MLPSGPLDKFGDSQSHHNVLRQGECEAPISMIRRLYLTAFLGLVLAGCESEPRFALSPVSMDCDQGSCLVALEITNTSDGELPLIYDISLSQNYIRDPNKSGLVVVGAADGEINIPPNETKRVEVEIDITETPNGGQRSPFLTHERQTSSWKSWILKRSACLQLAVKRLFACGRTCH